MMPTTRDDERGWGFGVPIYSGLIREKMRGADIEALIRRGVLERSGYSHLKHKCREYRLADWFEREIDDAVAGIPAEEFAEQTFLNIYSGRKRGKRTGNRIYDQNGHLLYNCDLAARSIECIRENGCVFNLTRVEAHIKRLKAYVEYVGQDYGYDSDEYHKAKRQWRNDENCFKAVKEGGIEHLYSDFYLYKPAYTILMSGRVAAIGGGFQTCSRAMKAAAFASVKNLHNVDLKSSQINGLIQFIDFANLDSSWPRKYRDFEEMYGLPAKEYYANKLGISVDLWKTLVLGVLFGGTMPQRLADDFYDRDNSLIDKVMRYTNKNVEHARAILEAARVELKPLTDLMKDWHKYLWNTWRKKNQIWAGRAGYISRNAAGAELRFNDLPTGREIWRAKSKLAAYLLQGMESSFIHHLTLIGQRTGKFSVHGNEHDGVLVVGAIGREHVQEAREKAGLLYAELEVKEFVEPIQTLFSCYLQYRVGKNRPRKSKGGYASFVSHHQAIDNFWNSIFW
jgi:hypothetical protein